MNGETTFPHTEAEHIMRRSIELGRRVEEIRNELRRYSEDTEDSDVTGLVWFCLSLLNEMDEAACPDALETALGVYDDYLRIFVRPRKTALTLVRPACPTGA